MFIAGRRKGIPLCDLCATEMRLRKTLEDTPSKVFCVLRLIEVPGASETQPVSPVTAARKDTVGFLHRHLLYLLQRFRNRRQCDNYKSNSRFKR